MTKIGNITKDPGAKPNDDEIKAALFLIDRGLNIKFLKASRIRGSKTPDFSINGVNWELKTPRKTGKYTLDHEERAGLKQSENLIFDLRRLKNTGAKAKAKLLRDFKIVKKWRRLAIITKEGELLTYDK
jgi:hypothetical protein